MLDGGATEPARRRGRPRSHDAEVAVLTAAASLMDEAMPADITAEAIASRAGVSKATLYKWWPTKTHVLMDAVLLRASQVIAIPDTGSAMDDFAQLLEAYIRFHIETQFGRAVSHIFAESLNDPELSKIYNERYALRRREALKAIWLRGVERGELRADIDPELALDMMYGPPLYRFFLRHQSLTPDMARSLVEILFNGARAAAY